MPKIGKRILKSSFAVFLCFVIYLLRGEKGIVFYSCIAAVLCVQQSSSNSISVARNRVEGTLIGGFMGMFILFIEKNFIPHDIILIQYILISFMIIPIIYITVVLKKTSASYISCVVFMSITVSHAMDVNPFMFAFDRMLDTIIGIFVALLINVIPYSFRRNKHKLFYIDLNQMACTSYEKIKLNHMIEHGAKIGFLCCETPGVFLPVINGIHTTLPIICFQGNAIFDIPSQSFQKINTFDNQTYDRIMNLLPTKASTFIYTIQHDMVHIYIKNLNDDGTVYVHNHRKQPYDHFICGEKQKDIGAVTIMVYMRKQDVCEFQTLCKTQLHTTCEIVEDHDMVKCYIMPYRDVAQELHGIANAQQCTSISLFQRNIISDHIITTYEDEHIISNLHHQFYTYKR